MNFSKPGPMNLGETLSGTDADGNLINDEHLGHIYNIPANDFSATQGIKARLSSRQIKAFLVRNVSGVTLYGKRLGTLRQAAGYDAFIAEVDGLAETLAHKGCVILDPYIATNGVADDDICWALVEGPCMLLTPDAGAAFNGDIAVAAPLVAATAAASTGTTAGRVSNVTLAGQTAATAAFNMAANLVGHALSARTTGETGAEILVNAQLRY